MCYTLFMGEKDIRIPKQKRSIEKKQRIKDAAMKLMSEKGYHQTSSNEIAKEAGVSIGTFYSYFKDKKELYAELVADIYAVVLTPVGLSEGRPEGDGLSIEKTVYGYISTVFKGHEYKTEFQREIASLSEQSDEFRSIEAVHKKELEEEFLSLLSAYSHEIKRRDLKTASHMVLTTVEAVIHDTKFHNNGRNRKAVMEELTDMIVNYLFVSGDQMGDG